MSELKEKNPKKKAQSKHTLKKLTELSFQIIVKAGAGKSFAMESLYAAKSENYADSDKKMEQAHQSLIEAEKEHFALIRDEAQGIKISVPLILMHAEDQLMSTQTIIILAEELINIYKKINVK